MSLLNIFYKSNTRQLAIKGKFFLQQSVEIEMTTAFYSSLVLNLKKNTDLNQKKNFA